MAGYDLDGYVRVSRIQMRVGYVEMAKEYGSGESSLDSMLSGLSVAC